MPMLLCLHLDVSLSVQWVSSAVQPPPELQHLQTSYNETQGAEIWKVVCQGAFSFQS